VPLEQFLKVESRELPIPKPLTGLLDVFSGLSKKEGCAR